MQKYTVNQYLINNLLNFVQTNQIAIPEIQRPFVWSSIKVRDLMDSLYRGFPIWYIIARKNPDVKLKDGTLSKGKMVLIDWQQRITALKASILWWEVVDKDYKRIRIRIAFNPITEEFETLTPAIEKDPRWIKDISEVMSNSSVLLNFVNTYCENNPDLDKNMIFEKITRLVDINNKQVWFIELAEDLDIETVTEIFIRINSEGVALSQADFAMSKIASHSDMGMNLRKCIDYFCHLAKEPKFYNDITQNDIDFWKTEYVSKIAWLKNENDDLYDPDYSDVIRVAFTKEFERGKLSDLVSLLSWRNFETRMFEQEIIDHSYEKLKNWILNFVNETNFKRFVMIIKSAWFIDKSLIKSQNVINFAYILYLKLRELKGNDPTIEKYVTRWFVMSMLTGRYSWSPESMFDYDIKHIVSEWIEKHLANLEEAKLSNAFWDVELVWDLSKAIVWSPALHVFRASQIKARDTGFLSKNITVEQLISLRWDIHHIFPKEFLKTKYTSRSDYNQIANYVYTQSEINIKIWKKAPKDYLADVKKQIEGWETKYWMITSEDEIRENFKQNCVPDMIWNWDMEDYEQFLEERRKLMAQKMKSYYFWL